MRKPISTGCTILGLLNHFHHLMTSMPSGAGGASVRPPRVIFGLGRSLWGYGNQTHLMNRARGGAPNLPHPEGAIRCSVKHLSKRCTGCVASKYGHNSTVVYPFGLPVARTARRALPYSKYLTVLYTLNANVARTARRALSYLIGICRYYCKSRLTDPPISSS